MTKFLADYNDCNVSLPGGSAIAAGAGGAALPADLPGLNRRHEGQALQ